MVFIDLSMDFQMNSPNKGVSPGLGTDKPKPKHKPKPKPEPSLVDTKFMDLWICFVIVLYYISY